MTKLRFGLFLDLPTETTTLDRIVADARPLIEQARAGGVDSIWAGESYPRGGGGFQHIPSPMLVLAALTTGSTMGIGTGVTIAPAWTPLRLAYDATMLDQLSGGRFELGLGLGSAPTWKQFGIDPASLGDWVDELILALKALWSGAAGFDGRLIQLEGAIGPAPIHPGGPPIRVGGKIGRSARRAALADGYLAGTHFRWSLVERQIERYRAALSELGKDPATAHVSINRIVAIGPDREAAWDKAGAPIGRLLRKYAALKMFDGWQALASADPSDLDAVRTAAEGMCLVGSTADVRAELQRYAAAGVDQIQLRLAPSGLDPAIASETLDALVRDVLPAFD